MASVLVIEDNDQVAELYVEWLVSAGHTADRTAAAYGAVLRSLDVHYDIIVMDLLLQGANGAVATLALRGLDALRGLNPRATPVIVVTGGLMPLEPRLVELVGFSGRLLKPIRGQELLDEITKQLSLDRVVQVGPKFRRVLVVTDDPIFASVLIQALSGAKFIVELAVNGSVALELLARNPFDFVVMDQVLPGRDGMTVAAEAHALGSLVPVILLTDKPFPEDERLASGVVASFPRLSSFSAIFAAFDRFMRKENG
jgi:CheY-like chemotaxis protein